MELPFFPQAPKRIMSTWKSVCDKSKDRTRELIKKWKSGGEGGDESRDGDSDVISREESGGGGNNGKGEKTWTVHVWSKQTFFQLLI